MPEPADTRIPAIGYIRVSMAREEMISPELQRAAIESWAARTNHRIVEWVEDLDKTGRNFKRKIMRAIERVEAGTVKRIAVWKYSRFGRNRTGIETNLARIENAGGQLMSATEEVDATTAAGWFQRDVIFSVAAYESKRAGEQWKETHDWRRENGLPASGMNRFGYIWHQRKIYEPDGTINLQEERYEPHPEQGPVVASLYERYINGESFRRLAIWLNSNGFRTVRGNAWTVNAIMRHLDSGFAAGYLRLHMDCQISDCTGACDNYQLTKHPTKHQPQLITEETWQRYLRRREQTRVRLRVRRATYPFSGFLRCGRCGGGIKRVGSAKAATRLICRRYDESGPAACAGSRVLISDVHTAVIDFLSKTAAPAIEASAERSPSAALTVVKALSPEAERERLEAQVTQLDKAIGKAMRTFAMSTDDDPDGILESEYRKLLTSLRDEKAQLAEAIKRLAPGAQETAQSRHGRAVRVALSLTAEWDTLSPSRINALLSHVIEGIVVRPDYEGLELQPTWSSEAWLWRGSGRPVMKRELIAEMWRRYPDSTGREIAELLAAEGVSVTPTYAIVTRGRIEVEGGIPRARRYTGGGSMTAERVELEKVRLQAVQRVDAGEGCREVAASLGVSKRSVERWHRAWRDRGEAGILSTARVGRQVTR